MGVDNADHFAVAELIGQKTFINEFYAYTQLAVYIEGKKNLTEYLALNGTSSNYTGTWTLFSNRSILLNDTGELIVRGILAVS